MVQALGKVEALQQIQVEKTLRFLWTRPRRFGRWYASIHFLELEQDPTSGRRDIVWLSERLCLLALSAGFVVDFYDISFPLISLLTSYPST